METMRRIARRLLPVAARRVLHGGYEALGEQVAKLLGRHDPLLPPTRLMFVGGSRADFRALGEKWLQTFIREGALVPTDAVLDVGCGVGRMAVPLTRFLTPASTYDGFDIVPEGIVWCQNAITARHPQFRFQHADIYNEEYNPHGTLRASEYRFPYDDESFTFVFLTSVFTHMLPPDVRHYLNEIRRVLKPGGRCLVTWFVVDAEARANIEGGRASPPRSFQRDLGGYWVVPRQTPEAAVAYSEADLRELYRTAGLMIREPIVYGGWSGRSGGHHSQDIVIARR